MEITETEIRNVLTRTSGYLKTVTTHSLQPYRGCTFGRSLCGVGCYVQHNRHVLKGRQWGGFLEVRTNAAESYLRNAPRERRYAERHGRRFSVFCSSATDPFVPQERRFGVTRSILCGMCEMPPDLLILQTHSHHVTDYIDVYQSLSRVCSFRVHVSIESDRDRLPGLPPPASSVEKRLAACAALRHAGCVTVVTVSPLLPIREPERFFARIADVADAVVIDHFIEGDGSADGSRTLRTKLPTAMRHLAPESISLAYRDAVVEVARRRLPGRVGVSIDGFAGRYL
jgi:DNA repair photolyase